MRVLWINGAYGVGKSTLADALYKLNKNSFVFDAEEVGNSVRENMPKELFNGYIFENYDLWFKHIADLLIEISFKYKGDVYVPMTLVYEDSFKKIKELTSKYEIEIKHILLESDYNTIHDRILARGEDEECWCMKNINMCIKNQKDFKDVIRIDSTYKSAIELAEFVLSL